MNSDTDRISEITSPAVELMPNNYLDQLLDERGGSHRRR
jgi:hypothetical protein